MIGVKIQRLSKIDFQDWMTIRSSHISLLFAFVLFEYCSGLAERMKDCHRSDFPWKQQ